MKDIDTEFVDTSFADMLARKSERYVHGMYELESGERFVSEPESGDGIMRTFEQCTEWAEWMGCDLRLPESNELFVDLDSEEAYSHFKHVWPIAKRHFAISYKESASKSGLPKRHIVVRLDKDTYTLTEKLVLQAALGSDGRREVMSLVRCMAREENVVVFFEPKKVIK